MSLIPNIPSHAKTVHRTAVAAGTIFIVPAGQTLYLMAVAGSIVQSGAPDAGFLTVDATSEDVGTTQTILAIPSTAVAGQVNALSHNGFIIRIDSGGTIVAASDAVGATITASIAGWLDRA